MKIASRKAVIRIGIAAGVLVLAAACCWWTMLRMPGENHTGPLPPLTESQQTLADRLESHVRALAEDIGPRNALFRRNYAAAAEYIMQEFERTGKAVETHVFEFNLGGSPGTGANLILEVPGGELADEIIIIGGHYDTCSTGPGANDNASGVATLIELSRIFARLKPARTIRFVAFANEEPPCFQSDAMGSLAYARQCRERNENIVAMLAIETIGCYSDARDSQQYPIAPLSFVYPDQGNFIAFVGNFGSRKLVREAIATFRTHTAFPSEGAALPGWIEGVGWSDHWAFWQCGYPGVMITDTAPFRYPHYHTLSDTPEKLDYARMARITQGLHEVISHLSADDRE